LLVIATTSFFAQNKIKQKQNVVKLKAGYVLYADDRLVIASSDTLVYLPLNVDFYIKKGHYTKSDKFYHELELKAYKKRWTREIHDVILVDVDTAYKKDTIKTQINVIPFLPYRNLIIRNIKLNKLDVFGPSVYSPDRKTTTWLGKTGNNIHIKTRDIIIKNHLLFNKGEFIDPYVLADNERILRELPYIEDARIIIENISPTGDSADIVVITKDNFSKGADITTADLKNIYIDIWDNNLAGTGHELNNTYFTNPDKLPESGIKGFYNIRNIGGSFVNSKISYAAFGNRSYIIDVWRDFFTQRTRYAGEVYYENFDRQYTRLKNDTGDYYYLPLSGTQTNIWLGRSFQIKKLGLYNTKLSNFSIAAGVYKTDFKNRPLVTPDYRYEYHKKTFYLFSYAFSNVGFYRSSLVYNYGRTEDIPYGTVLKFTQGVEESEFNSRIYNGVSFLKGINISWLGFTYFNVAFGGYFNDNVFEQGMLNASFNYFSNLLVISQFKFRHFLNIDYTKGYNRFKDEFLDINDYSGVRGFTNDSARGTQKLVINWESVSFTPFYLAGFRFAIFGFADFAYVGSTYQWVFKNNLYSGFGLGIRMRNERFVFKTFQIRFAYYPYLTKRASGDIFTLSQEWRFKPQDFNVKSPEILKYK
jgi:hypothetical protein